MTAKDVLIAVTFPECCRRIGLSHRHGQRLIADGKFPVPYLPRLCARGRYRFSEKDIDNYLALASTEDARVRSRRPSRLRAVK